MSRSTHQEAGGLAEAGPAVGLEGEEAGRRNWLVGIDHLLGPSSTAHIVFDFACSGVGTAACGPGVLPKYQLPAQNFSGQVLFEFES